ncbi:D-alanyl-D-alanine carboxypeptidase/D-alanyl-D-alanine-endopeptidase (penicillin-binding protein 4) [Phycicoccus badiiscoriae]|uniref:D-alanyl-D-alanine carboxypeptidase/D-alanyl-D-alanine-endopeptidase (Penicillin-binding protein 4) n=1 Tax=Pedococcus badiiscoriae TaxID=642776 RepID=A0A852WDJ7_9MICO|nr:D-alanyl-D-alanine carboxypeptidase [Pedococcus badiiscoriae]NYG07263.1 D-alanyl-D-alanine carboxypeptidase/D-alanyl-D-alanine-endopeptidase (penicillin-binding protein 4) [Pedococcus badiiscoriae]
MTSRPRPVTLRRFTTAVVASTLGLAPAIASSATAQAQVAAAIATVKPAVTPSTSDARVASLLTSRVTTARFGTAFSGAVIDAATGRLVWSKNGSTGLMPASTTKWATATDALRVLGPSRRFDTTVKRGYQADQVILVGSGDPSFSSTQLAALATTTAAVMKAKHQPRIRLYADDTLFAPPSLATGWRSTYIPADTTWVRALIVDGRQVTDTTTDAANLFAARLKAKGLTVTVMGRGRATAANPLIATSSGRTVSQLVSWMMLESDNGYAEALHRLVGIKLGYGNTWAAAKSAQSAQLAREGLTANALYDGSGLSRSDRLTGLQLTRLVTNIFEPANAAPLGTLSSDAGLPVSGMTGTLRASYGRFTASTSKCAVGQVHAKTGTLTDAVALVGWTRGKDGQVKAFAFVINGKPTSVTLMRQNIDMLAATVNGCY